MSSKNSNGNSPENDQFIEGVDYYIEKGLYVFTEFYLKKRGYCCGNKCRHCPYDNDKIDTVNDNF